MNAQILRKWSPFKSLMYLWLVILVLFSIIWCPGALAMHLTPLTPTTTTTKNQQLSPQQRSSSENGGVLNYSNINASSRSRSNTSNINNKPSRSELDQKLLTTHLHQITNNTHSNNNYWTPQQQPDSKRTNEIARWRHRMNEKRNRIRKHRRNLLLEGARNASTPLDLDLDLQTLRNRRDSVGRQNAQNRLEREHKRYCSARDPAVLAFEAPTVFEGKIKSMSHNRLGPYSVTFERFHVYKQPAGSVIPPKVRLRFERTDNRTECDIYRQEFKARGPIRGDVLEQGKLYFLFVKQIDVGNFTILGQPIRKTKKTEKEVEAGASSNYGKFF